MTLTTTYSGRRIDGGFADCAVRTLAKLAADVPELPSTAAEASLTAHCAAHDGAMTALSV
jgi:hypothetical protein